MRKLSTLILLIFSLAVISNAQEAIYDINTPNLLKHFIANGTQKGPAIAINASNCISLPLNITTLKKSKLTLILIENKAYITIDGSGMVYKWQKLLKDGMSRFIRIDSTTHSGNNYKSLSFGYNKNLYNIGGYGFWRTNGQLRSFILKTNDWSIEPLNREVQIDKEEDYPIIWFDEFNDQIITLQSKYQNQSIKGKTQIIDSVYALDLKTKTWNVLGTLDKNIKEMLKEVSILTNTEFGVITHNTSQIESEVWDIKNNVVLSISKEFQNKLPVSKIVDYTIWYEKPYLYLYDKNSDKIDSLMFTAQLLTKTDKKIYEDNKLNNTTLMSILILFIPLIVFIAGLYYYIRKRKKAVKDIEQVELKSAIGTNSLFTEIEKTLIDLIISNIKDSNRLTSIDEVNYILGISNKTINMQKRTRSDIISSINSKYQIYFKTDTSLILRQNSEIDQRVKEFYIEAENINKILPIAQIKLSSHPKILQ